MAEENEVFEAAGLLHNFKSKSNFDIEVSFDFTEDQLSNAMQFMAAIAKRIKVIAKIGEAKVTLGTFRFHSFKVDRDANSRLVLKTNMDDCNSLDSIMAMGNPEEQYIVLKAKIGEE